MSRLLPLLLIPALSAGQSNWTRIHPEYIGYGSGTFTPGAYSCIARDSSDIIVSGKYYDGGFYNSSVYENHYARLRVTAAETTMTLIKKNWWRNVTPGNGENLQDSSINLTDPTPPSRYPIFTVAGRHLYQVAGQNYRIKPRRSFQASGVDVSTDEITLDGSGSPVTPFTNLDEVTVKSSESLPGGLAASTVYYLIRVSGTKIKLASSLANARSGTAINLTSQGAGLDSLIREPDQPSDVWKMNLDTSAGDYGTWSQVFPTASSTYLMGQNAVGMSMVWDPYRNSLIASNLTGQPYGSRRTWRLDVMSSEWLEGSQSAGAGDAPENQSGQQMTFNTRDSTAWLFGAGNLSTGGNELWHYLPGTGLWSKLTPVTPRPANRVFHCVAYVRGATANDDVLFVSGGVAGEGGTGLRDSWVYHIQANSWDSLAVSTLPNGAQCKCQWEPNSARVFMQADTAWWVYPVGITVPPVVTDDPDDASIYAGQAATFNVSATGTQPLSYQWRKNGVSISGATLAAYTTPVLTLSDNGNQYSVIVTNVAGADTSANATVSVSPAQEAPVITSQPTSQTTSEGLAVTFSITATGYPAPTYQWKRDDVALPGATSSIYTIGSAYLSDGGAVYKVVVSNTSGSAISNLCTLSINARIPSADSNLTAWPHTKKVFINTTTSGADIANDVHGFPLAIRLTRKNFHFTQARTDGEDIRFSKPDGTRLPHEIELWDAVACSALVWVGLDTVRGNDSAQHVLMHWGKLNADRDNDWYAVFDSSKGFGGVWHLNEKPNDHPKILRDRSPFRRFGTGSGFSSNGWIGGVLGKATNFDGSNDNIGLGSNIPLLDTVGAASFSAWVYLTVPTAKNVILGISKGNGGTATTDSRFSVFLEGGKIHAEGRAGDGETIQSVATTDTVPRTQWIHLAAVADYAQDSIHIYFNGIRQSVTGTPTFTATATSSANSTNGAMGADDNGATKFLLGRIDEAQLSRVKRSPDWVKLAYENEKPGSAILSMRDAYPQWTYDRKIFLNTTSAGAGINDTLVDFPILVRLGMGDIPFSQAQGNGEDLRFSDSKGAPIPASVQKWDSAGSSALAWVKVDTILGNSSQQFITMHWGNSQTLPGGRSQAVFDTSRGYGGVWHLDESPSGGADAVKDGTFWANHGTTGGGMVLADTLVGQVGRAIRFDGSNDFLDIGDSLKIATKVKGITLSTWLRLHALPTTEKMVLGLSIDASTPQKKPRAGLLMDGRKLKVIGRSEDYGDVATVISQDSLDTDSWYHVAGMIDYKNDSIKIYVNGQGWSTTGSVSFLDTITEWSSTRSNKLAALGDLSNGFLPGALDEVQVFKASRSQDWIKLQYQNQKSGSTFLQFESGLEVVITSPAEGFTTNQGTITITWTVGGVTQGTQNSEVLEEEGSNLVIRCSGSACDTITVIRDQTPPSVEITFPADGAIIHEAETGVAWEVDGTPQGTLLTEELEVGENLIIRSAQDALGNAAYDTVTVTYTLDPPVVIIVSPAQGTEIFSTPVSVQWTVDGVTQTSQLTESLAEGVYTISRQSIYNGGTQSVSASVQIYFDSQPEECLDP